MNEPITLPNGYVITTRLAKTPQEYYTAKYEDNVYTSKSKSYIMRKASEQVGNKLKGSTKMYCLVKFSKDWADEFNVYGFSIFKKDEWEDLNKKLITRKEEDAGGFYFGTNEGWEEETIGDFLRDIEVTTITEEEKNLLTKLFGKNYYGVFPDFRNMLNKESEEE